MQPCALEEELINYWTACLIREYYHKSDKVALRLWEFRNCMEKNKKLPIP